jgi:predicted nucleic acid-binding protein
VSDVLADTSVWMRRGQDDVAVELAEALTADRVLMTTVIELELLRVARNADALGRLGREYGILRRVPMTSAVEARAVEILGMLAWRGYHRGPSPVDLMAAAAAESAGAELWHCDRHFELIADVTGQPMRRVGT